MAGTVVVLGGGVGGLSAAHELVERGFQVELYELRATLGGKARSIPIEGSAPSGRDPLPGEHGFRFFPGFYKHLPDTMRRIPYAGQADGVLGNLVQAREYLIASGSANVTLSAAFPRTLGDVLTALRRLFDVRQLGVPEHELAFFAARLLTILTSCSERRDAELDAVPWWDFIGAETRSEAYRSFLAVGLTRTLVALKAQEASTRTVGNILIQLLLDTWSPRNELDRILAGPTSELWIDPWRAYLGARGVKFRLGAELVGLELAGKRLVRARLRDAASGSVYAAEADYFVSALPIERFAPLVTPELRALAPALSRLEQLRVSWMNGLQLYLREDEKLAAGHANFVNTPSALTAISQNQFWRRPVSDYGDGTARGCFSIDISNWESAGIVYGKPLKDLTDPAQVKDEVLAQLRAALRDDAAFLSEQNVVRWFLDPDIVFPNGAPSTNLEPLLINTAGSLPLRPEVGPHFETLFLASDYVRTYSDLACMESANEAARRAVNGILTASSARATPCALWPLSEPALFAPARALDRAAFRLGLPHPGFPSRVLPRLAPLATVHTRAVRELVRGLVPPFGGEHGDRRDHA